MSDLRGLIRVHRTQYSYLQLNYLSVENLKRSYGERVLFEDLCFGISKGQKVALVARNGTGKTSLLNIIAGLEPPEAGEVVKRRELRMGFLQQDPQFPKDLSVMNAILNAEDERMKAVRDYEKCLLNPDDDKAYQAAFNKMDSLNAWNLESTIKEVLGKLNITDLDQPTGTLSGGQRKRVALAKLLVDEPDLIILDEPTNHLDLQMIEWLEKFLNTADRTLLMVTHDRVFLDRVCDNILELEDSQIYRHKGNYSFYLENKSNREDVQKANVDKAQNLYRKELDWMRRMPKARTTKSKSREGAFYDVEKTAKTNLKRDELKLEISLERLGGKIVELHKVKKQYGDKIILDGLDYKFQHRERMAIVGFNGSGKSTFLKMIIGEEEPDGGKVVIGDTVKFGYFGQEGMKLKEDKRMKEVITDIAEFIPLKKGKTISAAQMLERFLFPRSSHFQRVNKLSGGERKRLYLLTVLMANPNFLILDEPTNDLDLLTLNVLEEFLEEYEGCLVIVTHDRHFMNKLSDHLFVFEGNGKIKDFPGTYSQYTVWKAQQDKTEKEEATAKALQPKAAESYADKKKMGFNEKREFGLLEVDIPKLEAQKVDLNGKLLVEADHEKLMELAQELETVTAKLEEKELRWLEL
ncbi:MAG: ATP-binding cassette subfamily F protein uup, partial [Bacteroidia bacterium]